MRAAGDVDHRPVGVAGDLADLRPRALLGLAVLGVDGEVGRAVVHPQLDHLPVALVQPDPERQVVVVVEVEEPVLQPQAPAGLDGVAVHAVAQVGSLGAQRDVLLAVVLLGVADAVVGAHLLAVGVLRSAPRKSESRASRRSPAAPRGRARRRRGAARCRVVGPFRGAVAEVLLHRVVLQAGLVAAQEVVVITHAPYRTHRRKAARSPLLSLISPRIAPSRRERASATGSGGLHGSQSRFAGHRAERDHEGTTVGQADVREVQDHPPPWRRPRDL